MSVPTFYVCPHRLPIMSVPTYYVRPHLLCLSPPIMSVPTFHVCPTYYVRPHLLCLSPPIMSVPTLMSVPTYYICPHPSFFLWQALLKSRVFEECQSVSGMFLKGIWTGFERFDGFFNPNQVGGGADLPPGWKNLIYLRNQKSDWPQTRL